MKRSFLKIFNLRYLLWGAFYLILVFGGFAAVQKGQQERLQEGLIGYWPFDGNGNDLSGAGRHLELFGEVGFAPGLFGQALDLHGNPNQFAQRPVDDEVYDFGANDFSLQIWVNYHSVNGEQCLIEKFYGQAGPGWTLTSFPPYAVQFYACPSFFVFLGVYMPTGMWHQIVIRRTGELLELFFDGEQVAQAFNPEPIPNSPLPLLIGKRNIYDGRDFPTNGRIDEVAIWNRALTDDEIAFLFNNGQGNPVVSITPGKVSGGGWIVIGRFRRTLQVDVEYTTLSGFIKTVVKYLNHSNRLNMEATEVTQFTISDNTAVIRGNCKVRSVSGYTFECEVSDTNPDYFSIIIKDSDGNIVDTASGTLTGGDFKVQRF